MTADPPPDAPTLDGPSAADTGPATDLPDRIGRYQILGELGRGGMGVVYQARDERLNRLVALKVQTGAQGTARFLREAQAAAALQHPNICPIYECGEFEGQPYLAMAFIEGRSLAQRLRTLPPLTVAEALTLVRQVALAMQYAHDHGVIHRDLKPANVMLDGQGTPIVMDFGLARIDAPLATQLTQQGDVLGTPAYMPPEQINGDVAAMGPAGDVYSLGVVLYEMLTGALPFSGDLMALASQINLDPPPPLTARRPDLSPRLEAACLRALAKAPADRWPSMRAFADALAQELPAPPRPRPGPMPATLSLRVEGSPVGYRAVPGQEVITVGRQKRKPGSPPAEGNDFVVRVVGNDDLSTRISRRHLEIRLEGGRYAAQDLSKAGTLLNGRPLPRDAATPLAAGDRLTLAGVLVLEVGLDAATLTGRSVSSAQVSVGGSPVVLEASLGDMVTME
jgi:serine/threonine protein kinase